MVSYDPYCGDLCCPGDTISMSCLSHFYLLHSSAVNSIALHGDVGSCGRLLSLFGGIALRKQRIPGTMHLYVTSSERIPFCAGVVHSYR